MANQPFKKHPNTRKDNGNRTIGSYQVESGVKKTAPQHAQSRTDHWWQSSLQNEECPITLEPFATLPYPPFSLYGGESHSGTKKTQLPTLSTDKLYYFDGFALASYLVARGIFENPLTRQALTMDDCRRLDDYLEVNRKYHAPSQLEYGSRTVSVAEAFSIQQSIQVERASSGANQTDQEETRAQVLRRTATAALAGLFDYSRPSQNRRQTRRQQRQGSNQMPEGSTTSNQDPRLAEWGLDLNRTVEASSGQSDTGWTIIDDDEALVTAAQRDAYEFVQNQFPRLSDRTIEGTVVHNYDESIVQTAKTIAFQEEQQKQRHAKAIAQAQQRLRIMALREHEELRKQQKEEWQQGHVQWEQEQREKEELMRAREEIDAWREEQWDTLRRISEEQIARRKKAEDHSKIDFDSKLENGDKAASPPDTSTSLEDVDTAIEEAESNKKAKAAAKRKRAKARKQEQKAAAQAALEEKQKEEDLLARKAASAMRCAACGGGMLDAGFEKFGQKFCSTKCARAAKPPA